MQNMHIYFTDWMPGMLVEVAWKGQKWRSFRGHYPRQAT